MSIYSLLIILLIVEDYISLHLIIASHIYQLLLIN